MSDMTDEQIRALLDAPPFDAYGAATEVGTLKAEAKAMPANLRRIGNALAEMVEAVVKSRIEDDKAKIALANAALSARAERDKLQGELIGVLNRETASLVRWEDKLEASQADAATLRDRLAVVERETWNAAIAEALKMVKSPPMMTQREALAIVSRKIKGLKK